MIIVLKNNTSYFNFEKTLNALNTDNRILMKTERPSKVSGGASGQPKGVE